MTGFVISVPWQQERKTQFQRNQCEVKKSCKIPKKEKKRKPPNSTSIAICPLLFGLPVEPVREDRVLCLDVNIEQITVD